MVQPMPGIAVFKAIAPIAAFICIDQVSKYMIQSSIGNRSFFIFPGFLAFEPTLTSTFLFNIKIPDYFHVPLVFLIVVMLIYCMVQKVKGKSRNGEVLGYILIIAGALSNLLDRVRFGGVVDWLSIPGIGASNFADGMIIVGAFTIVCMLVKNKI